MTYSQWFKQHGEKHAKIMQKLTHLSDNEVIEYFRFENMVEKEPDFCPLYAKNQKCHDMEQLNCYLCACPYFRFNDDGLYIKEKRIYYSDCSIHAKKGKKFIAENAVHQDCSLCLLPHKVSFIQKIFKREWFAMMQECNSIALQSPQGKD